MLKGVSKRDPPTSGVGSADLVKNGRPRVTGRAVGRGEGQRFSGWASPHFSGPHRLPPPRAPCLPLTSPQPPAPTRPGLRPSAHPLLPAPRPRPWLVAPADSPFRRWGPWLSPPPQLRCHLHPCPIWSTPGHPVPLPCFHPCLSSERWWKSVPCLPPCLTPAGPTAWGAARHRQDVVGSPQGPPPRLRGGTEGNRQIRVTSRDPRRRADETPPPGCACSRHRLSIGFPALREKS